MATAADVLVQIICQLEIIDGDYSSYRYMKIKFAEELSMH